MSSPPVSLPRVLNFNVSQTIAIVDELTRAQGALDRSTLAMAAIVSGVRRLKRENMLAQLAHMLPLLLRLDAHVLRARFLRNEALATFIAAELHSALVHVKLVAFDDGAGKESLAASVALKFLLLN